MMTTKPMHLAILAAALAASVASAQQRDYGRPLDTPENRASGMLRYSGYCAINEVAATARKVLETEIGSDEEAKSVKRLVGLAKKCYRPEWPPFQPTAVRNSIAEALYLASYRTNAPKAAGAVTPPASFGVVSAGKTGTPQQEAVWALAAIANCTVYADPANVRELLLGPANVPEETKRFDKLRRAIAKCVGPNDAALLTPQTARGFLAAALYSRAQGK